MNDVLTKEQKVNALFQLSDDQIKVMRYDSTRKFQTHYKMYNQIIPSVNFHLWKPCNFRCKFCFATFSDVRQTILPKGHLNEDDALLIVELLAAAGFSKITFAGGEPTLCPWLGSLIKAAKKSGLTTMIVTNGSQLSENFLSAYGKHIDWIALSVDSAISSTNKASGRSQKIKIEPDADWYLKNAELIKSFGIRFKVNTVVHRYNYQEHELQSLVAQLAPERWKVFQVLPIQGQNDRFFDLFSITKDQFQKFKILVPKQLSFPVIFEDNEAMRGSYAMVDPAGRFYDNTKGSHTYSEPILKIGVGKALQQVACSYGDFLKRGGLYPWK